MDPPQDSVPLSPAANKKTNSCTDLILHAGSSNRPSSCPQPRFFSRLPDEIILMICQQVYDGGFGRSALSKLGQTCRRVHAFALPLLYKEIKAMAGCCRPIRGRYEPRVPCSCSDEKRNRGFPRLDLPFLVATFIDYPHLGALVQTIDLDRHKKSATGEQIFDYGEQDCLLPFLFTLPHVKSIKVPASKDWAADAAMLGQLSLAETHKMRFPSITHLHIRNNTVSPQLWAKAWSLISACTNLEVLHLERPRGSVYGWLMPRDFTPPPVTNPRWITEQIHFPNLIDLDITHNELCSYDFAKITQSCTQLRYVSLVQFQPVTTLAVQAEATIISPGPARIIKCLAASAATMEKMSISWAGRDFARTLTVRPDVMALIRPMRGFSALRLLELSYKDLEKGGEGVLVNLIKDCGKLEAFKLIGITNMPRTVLYYFACRVSEGTFPRLRMLKLCTNMKDSRAWAELKRIADHDIVSLLAAGQVKLVLRPHHRKPGDPRFPELNFKGDDGEPTAPDASSA
jgi:hypothetical protein